MLTLVQPIAGMPRTGASLERLEPCEGKLSRTVLRWDGINAVLAEYVATYLLSLGTYILASLIAAVPYFGGLIWPFLCFYLLLVQARLFGEICGKAA